MTKDLPPSHATSWNEDYAISGLNACNDSEIRLAFYQTLGKKIAQPTIRLSEKFINAIITDVNTGKSAHTPEVDVAALDVIQSTIYTLEHPLSAGLAREVIGYEKNRTGTFTACAPNEKGAVTAARANVIYAHAARFMPHINDKVVSFIVRHYINEKHEPKHLANALLLLHTILRIEPTFANHLQLESINTVIATTKDPFLRDYRDSLFDHLNTRCPEVIDRARIGYRLRKATAALNAFG
ncbi:MAG: hypothetical protein EOM37_07085 [Proteobacteria bacterium]|jgi:hypothetical protein|nr:hypothetical protein [Alphaproteobacteria bacterium]NCC03793.1 hypothetical protein [Pseudomonadota bacterium]